ncbi:hypothetical protein EVC02_081 [Rhizobium phage RHph_N17]|nr:hypothetical protein EVC02_081 [Rhizobium phage RHph_N17]
MVKWIVLWIALAFLLAFVLGAFADPAQERCEQIYSHDACFQMLNR